MKRRATFLTIFSIIFSLFVLNTSVVANAATVSGDDSSFNQQMLSYVNSVRKANNVPALKANSQLNAAAVNWSKRMAKGETDMNLEHNPAGAGIITKFGFSNWQMWGENVAKFPTGATAKQVFDSYMASPGHKANILKKEYAYLGLGTIANTERAISFNTMEFAKKMGEDNTEPPKTSSPKKPNPSKETNKTKSSEPTKTTAPKKVVLGKEATYYVTSKANVRSGPGTNYKVVGSVKLNQKITGKAYGDTGWVQIDKNHYISSSLLTTKKPTVKESVVVTQSSPASPPKTTSTTSAPDKPKATIEPPETVTPSTTSQSSETLTEGQKLIEVEKVLKKIIKALLKI